MSKFKIGDRVKIPTTKIIGNPIMYFTEELNSCEYKRDYLLVKNMDVKRGDGIRVFLPR